MEEYIREFIYESRTHLSSCQELVDFKESRNEYVRKYVERVWVGECSGPASTAERHGFDSNDIALENADLSIHVYQLHDQEAVEEYGDMGPGGEEPAMMAHHWTLPCEDLEGIWETMVFDDQIQSRLLEYVHTAMLFSDKSVNTNLVSWNRVALLHGPPGTGKTSLCRGLAQKLAIRLSERYRYGKLLEINSHSLFSKWFSESGKMVQRMFDQIWTMVEDDNAFICVLIDEVESLAAARKAALSGNEPSDSIRVVNALLTQIDRLKKRKNVLILTTSNITEAIDLAFIDRADIKLRIGLPSRNAIDSLLESSIRELQRVGIIQPFTAPEDELGLRRELYAIANLATGMSGRTVRKLCFLAHAAYVR
ncbi:Pachytene checkpoint protein 2, partial [Dissophora globulifera]